MGAHRKYNDLSATGIRPRLVRRSDREENRVSDVVPAHRDPGRTDSLFPPGSSAADRRRDSVEIEIETSPDSTPLSLPPVAVEVVPTPTGEEVVFPGWDRHKTVVMKAVTKEMIDACRELPKTIPSMKAITLPPPPFRKVK